MSKVHNHEGKRHVADMHAAKSRGFSPIAAYKQVAIANCNEQYEVKSPLSPTPWRGWKHIPRTIPCFWWKWGQKIRLLLEFSHIHLEMSSHDWILALCSHTVPWDTCTIRNHDPGISTKGNHFWQVYVHMLASWLPWIKLLITTCTYALWHMTLCSKTLLWGTLNQICQEFTLPFLLFTQKAHRYPKKNKPPKP